MFEGTAEFSTCDALKKQLSDNLATYQEFIDIEFPSDQPQHARTHAIFSAIIRSTNPSVLGGAGAVYVTYPALNARDYVNRTALGT